MFTHSLGAFIGCLALCCVAGCDYAVPEVQPKARPTRVVSLDYCADQFLLQLADRDQIAAVSVHATEPFSYLRDRAGDYSQISPKMASVIAMKPDLVLRTYGGGVNTTRWLTRAGIDVVQIPWVTQFDGETGSVSAAVERVAAALHQRQRGEQLIADYRQRLGAIAPTSRRPEALYVSNGGATTGPGSLIDEMLIKAGLNNFERRPGWHSLPLERLAYEKPEVMVEVVFGRSDFIDVGWSPARHPIVKRVRENARRVVLDSATTACGGWFATDAVERLAKAVNP